MATAVERDEEVVSLELPAPPGWKKNYVITNSGGTPKKKDIVFTSPTGDEITNRNSLDQYLSLTPVGPSHPSFIRELVTPLRKSAMIIKKAKVVSPRPRPRPPPHLEIEQQPTKKRRSSITRKEEKEKDAASEETKEVAVAADSMKENPETENASENTVKENHSEKTEDETEGIKKTSAAAGKPDDPSTEKLKKEEPESKDDEKKEEENSDNAVNPVELETNNKSTTANGIEEHEKSGAINDVVIADQQVEGEMTENGNTQLLIV